MVWITEKSDGNAEIINLLDTSSGPFSIGPSVVGLGNFDGVHLGHQEIVKNCVYFAKILGAKPVVVSFLPHPVSLIRPESYLGLIESYEDKVNKLLNLGIANVISLKFDQAFAKLPAHEFINLLFKKFNPKKIITGSNFLYGHKKSGNVSTLHLEASTYGFSYTPIQQVFFEGMAISSSLVRDALSKGFIEKVKKLLGDANYSLSGTVTKGSQIASSKLEIPTANFAWPAELFQVKAGVYLSKVYVADNVFYFGLTHIGHRPSLTENNRVWVETHLFDFKGDLYGVTIKIELLSFLRPERKFASLETLKAQIDADIRLARHLINFGLERVV
ncbi:MAG: riboflavin biosynthesis protein RibF [Candidatus Midichloria mitochondrii]|nr:riboflavin biosynthesis protein RibF [Candidatus Midichloria mitochondrii]